MPGREPLQPLADVAGAGCRVRISGGLVRTCCQAWEPLALVVNG